MSVNFFASEEELTLVARIYDFAGISRPGVISGDAAVEIFADNVDLPPIILSKIWNIADEDMAGSLSERGLAIAIRLIGWAQSGREVNVNLINIPGPLPCIKGVSEVGNNTKEHTSEWPTFTQHDKDTFEKLFLNNGPINGLLDGNRVRDLFVKSKLSPKVLWQIWNIVDTQKRGALDSNEFALGMYFIKSSMSGKVSAVPRSIPDQVYEQIFGKTMNSENAKASLPTPISSNRSPSPETIAPTSPVVSPDPPRETNIHHEWDINPIDKAAADRDFDILDPQKSGYLGGDVVAKFMLRFKLPPEDLAQIWDLADINNVGRLTREEFAVAMHLIQQTLAGVQLPSALPLSLIPPPMRIKAPDDSLQSLKPINTPLKLKSELIVPQSERRPRRAPPLPPKPTSPKDVQRPRAYSTPSNSKVKNYKVHSPIPEQQPSTVSIDEHRNLERENAFLTSKVEELLTQLEVRHDVQTQNEALIRENESLSKKIHEMEQITSQLLIANDTNPIVENLRDENRQLTHQIIEMDQIRSELAEKSRHLDLSTQENGYLGSRLQEVSDAAELASLRSAEEINALKIKIESLEQDNEHLRHRTKEMERAFSRSQPSSSTTNVQEMQILMGDITRENEELKWRNRKMQRSTAHLLMMSSAGQNINDELKRKNQHLAAQVAELEQLTRQLQSSTEDNELRQMLNDVTHENEALRGSLRELRHQITQIRPSSRVEDLQREISNLKEEIRRLQTEVQSVPLHEDPSIPPPAYEDSMTIS